MSSASSLFLYFRNLLLEIFSELDEIYGDYCYAKT